MPASCECPPVMPIGAAHPHADPHVTTGGTAACATLLLLDRIADHSPLSGLRHATLAPPTARSGVCDRRPSPRGACHPTILQMILFKRMNPLVYM